MSDADRALRSRLLKLESRFIWDLRREDLDLEGLSTRLQDQTDGDLDQQDTTDHCFSFLAYVRYLQDRPEEAMVLLHQSEERTRERFGEESERRLIVTYGDLAWLSYHTGDYAQSEAYCCRVEDILLKNPTGSPMVLHPEVYGEKAWTFFKFSMHYYPKAIECFLRALELQPDNGEWNKGYAITLYRFEPRTPLPSESPEDSPAVKQLRRALEIRPDNGELLVLLALKLSSYKEHQEADGLVQRALEIGPDSPHITRYVAKYLRYQGEVDRSIELLQQALQKNSQSAFIHHQLALCYKNQMYSSRNCNQRMDLRRLSIQHLEKAVRLKPSFVIALCDLAQMYAGENEITRAENMFQEAFELAAERSVIDRQFSHLRYAQFHFYNTKQDAQAITHYTKGLLLTATSTEGKQCALKLRQIAEWRLSKDANDGEAFGVLGLVCRAQGELREAAEYYEKALTCDLNNQQHRSALSDLRMELQRAEAFKDPGA